MSFVVEPAVMITAEHMENPLFLPLVMVGDRKFIALKKSDIKTERLLVQKHWSKERQLPKTSIIDTISELSNVAFWNHVRDQVNNAQKRELSTVNRRSRSTRVPATMVNDTPATIEIESIGDIPAKSMSVLLRQQPHTAMIELTAENLKYLADVVAFQLSQGDAFRKRPHRNDELVFNNGGSIGISMDYNKKKLRVQKKNANGVQKNKYIPVTDNQEDAKEEAENWLRREGEDESMEDAVNESP